MPSKPNKQNLQRVFALVQFYGESLHHLRDIVESEEEILEKNYYYPVHVAHLLNLRTRRSHVELALKTIAVELEEQHGFRIPGVTGWRMFDEYRFNPGPFPSISGLDECVF